MDVVPEALRERVSDVDCESETLLLAVKVVEALVDVVELNDLVMESEVDCEGEPLLESDDEGVTVTLWQHSENEGLPVEVLLLGTDDVTLPLCEGPLDVREVESDLDELTNRVVLWLVVSLILLVIEALVDDAAVLLKERVTEYVLVPLLLVHVTEWLLLSLELEVEREEDAVLDAKEGVMLLLDDRIIVVELAQKMTFNSTMQTKEKKNA